MRNDPIGRQTMKKSLFLLFLLLIQPSVPHPALALESAPRPENMNAVRVTEKILSSSLQTLDDQNFKTTAEIIIRLKRAETLVLAEDDGDTDSGAETSTGEDETDADTDSDSDDDADRGDSALTPAEQ